MDLKAALGSTDQHLLIFVITSLFALVAWIFKSLIEAPLLQSKETFQKYFEKRILALSEVLSYLKFIAFFPSGEDGKEYKTNLQALLLKGEKIAYLSKSTYDKVLKISISEETDEKLLLKIISEIESELETLLSKVREDIQFYYRFGSLEPFQRLSRLILLLTYYLLTVSIIVGMILLLGYALTHIALFLILGVLLVIAIAVYLATRYFSSPS